MQILCIHIWTQERNCGKVLLSGTYQSSKDSGRKFCFFLQISNIWVWLNMRKALKPLFDLFQESKPCNLSCSPICSDIFLTGYLPNMFWDISSYFSLWHTHTTPVPPKGSLQKVNAKNIWNFQYDREGQPTYGKFHMFFAFYFLKTSLNRSINLIIFIQYLPSAAT